MGTKNLYQEFISHTGRDNAAYLRNKGIFHSFTPSEVESFLTSFIKFISIAKDEITRSAISSKNDLEYFRKAELINSIDCLLEKFLDGKAEKVKEEVPFVLTLFQQQQYVLPEEINSPFCKR